VRLEAAPHRTFADWYVEGLKKNTGRHRSALTWAAAVNGQGLDANRTRGCLRGAFHALNAHADRYRKSKPVTHTEPREGAVGRDRLADSLLSFHRLELQAAEALP
jgi:hypothetical protein